MKSFIKRAAALAGATVVTMSLAANVLARESYDPYSYDRWGDAVSSQAGYVAEEFIDGQLINGLYEKVESMEGFDYDEEEWKQKLSLKEPADLFISYEDYLYICDKGNNRIIATDLDFNMVRYLDTFYLDGQETTLNAPQGVFVDPYNDHELYVCDTENSRVLRCDKEGNVLQVFTKPTSEIYSQDLTYKPEKVVVDKAGNVYVVVGSVTKGAVMYDRSGEFLGFFGANRVEATAEIIMNAFWNKIATEEQQARSVRATAIGFDNFDIDDMGFIYTVTQSSDVDTDTVKKVNPEGVNILSTLNPEDITFGDHSPAYWSIYTKQSALVDIDIGPNGELNILDFNHGRVFQYDKLANLMFVIGGSGNQLGTFLSATAIESHDDMIYVLDSRKNGITTFRRSDFGEIVTNATNLYNEGYYNESYEPWCEVVKRDGNYRRAYIGIGNALMQKEQYKDAMKYFKVAISRDRYNKAFEGWRDKILQKWLTPVVVCIIIIAIISAIIKALVKRGIIKLPKIQWPWKRRGA
ncbi:MAG: hypothetical protein II714_06125 [Oscillospiraceae bacterium]|nr:hypothetical protein [Oscillospiraceae bacterium]